MAPAPAGGARSTMASGGRRPDDAPRRGSPPPTTGRAGSVPARPSAGSGTGDGRRFRKPPPQVLPGQRALVVGELERVLHGAAQDLLVIRTPDREVLFPFVGALVPEVDVAGGRIVIDDKPGLLVEP